MFRLSTGRRIVVLAALLGSGVCFQFGSCAAGLTNIGLGALDFCTIINTVGGRTDCTIGPFAPCGIPDFQVVDQDGLPTGTVQAAEDDLLLDCPVTFVHPTTGGGGS